MTNNRILAGWSGGVDSTYMIYQYLQQGFEVDVVYGRYKNSFLKSNREEKARKIMKEKFFDVVFPGKLRHVNTVEVDLKNGVDAFLLNQVPPWLLTLVSAVNGTHSQVAMGYVMNDDAISFLDEIRTLWSAYGGLLRYAQPPLVFPLSRTKKERAFSLLPLELKEHVTWCENIAKEDRCGVCIPCKRMIQLGLQEEPVIPKVRKGKRPQLIQIG